jgi:hypothetical protein
MRPLRPAHWSAVLACALGGVIGCGGSEFASSTGDGGSASAGRGGESAASAGGSGSSGGGGPSGGEASGEGGAGGNIDDTCNCASGEYCRAASNVCYACSDFSRLNFSAPEKLVIISQAAAGSARYPRLGPSGQDLFYRSAATGEPTVFYTSDMVNLTGGPMQPPAGEENAALFLPVSVSAGGVTFNFAFDAVGGPYRNLQFATWNDGVAISALAPSPYSKASFHSSHMAVAFRATGLNAPRAYWVETQQYPVVKSQLFTKVMGDDDGPAEAVTLLLGPGNCAATPAQLSPWVSPDGTQLLVTNRGLDQTCTPNGVGTEIYLVSMDPLTGQQLPSTGGIALKDVNGPSDETDASFSWDMCELYFASSREREPESYDLYRAQRR